MIDMAKEQSMTTQTERPERLVGNRILPNGSKFTWGPIVQIHEVGPYMVVEYLDDRSNFGSSRDWASHGRHLFEAWLDGKSQHRSYFSLSSALVGVIAVEREGPNSSAGFYFDRMTGVQA